jgi:predicted ArsR family transcriptional regulator
VDDDVLDARVHRALADPSRVRVLQAVRDGGVADARELAKRVKLHPNTVRAHLAVLADAGLVSRRFEASRPVPGRPRVLFEPVDEPAPRGEAGGYVMLSEMLASFLAGAVPDPAAAAERAGHAWGRYLADRPAPFTRLGLGPAAERLAALMRGLGFDPTVEATAGEPAAPDGQQEAELRAGAEAGAEGEVRMILHRCPFRAVADRYRDVVCSLHLGMLRGALAELDALVEARRLDPSTGPTRCVAHLGQRRSTPLPPVG